MVRDWTGWRGEWRRLERERMLSILPYTVIHSAIYWGARWGTGQAGGEHGGGNNREIMLFILPYTDLYDEVLERVEGSMEGVRIGT
jgi:hypothetical protein